MAVIRVGDCRHDGIAHLRGTATDAGILDRDGKDETGGVGITVSDCPGVRGLCQIGGGRAGQEVCGGVHGQAAGKGVTRQGIDQPAVAADGSRQPQRWDGGLCGVEQVTHRGHAEARDAPGIDHGHGEGQGIRIFGRPVGVRVHDRPGQGDGRPRGGGDAGQGAGAGGVAQTGGKVAAIQFVDQGAVAAGGFRQRQYRDDVTNGVDLRGDGARAEIRPQVVAVRHRDHEGNGGDAVVAAHRIRDGGKVVGGVRVSNGGDGDGPGTTPVCRCERQGTGGEADVAVGGTDARGERHVTGGDGVQRHGVGRRAVFGHGESDRVEDNAGARR